MQVEELFERVQAIAPERITALQSSHSGSSTSDGLGGRVAVGDTVLIPSLGVLGMTKGKVVKVGGWASVWHRSH